MRGVKCTNGAEMTEEEALAEQQRMFAEARARMNGGVAVGGVVAKQPQVGVEVEVEPNLEAADS